MLSDPSDRSIFKFSDIIMVTSKQITIFPIELKNSGSGIHKNIAYSLQFGIDGLLGDILTVLDTLNLPEKQFKAVKQLVKEKYWKRYRETADNLSKIYFEMDRIQNIPVSDGYLVLGQNEVITGCGKLPETD